VSLAQKVRLTLDDGREIETVYDGRDLRAWEGVNHKSALVESMSLSMLTWLGHHAAVRRGDLNGDMKDYKAFDQACISVEGVRDEVVEPPDPTPPKTRHRASPRTAGGGSSAPSP
jgi:hypothetical protein